MKPVPYRPFPYQQQMLDWLDARQHSLLFCSMGLGKTVVTLRWIADKILTGECRAALIVAPIRVCKITWPSQVAKWDFCSWMRVADMRTPEGEAMWESGDFEIALINPEQLASREINTKCRKCRGEGCAKCGGAGHTISKAKGFVERFIAKRKTLPVDMLVWDETSLAKNPSSKRVNALRPYLHDKAMPSGKEFKSQFRHITGLTGTPVPNTYLDLFAQVRLIDGGKRLGQSFTRFRDQYFTSDFMGYKWAIKPGAKQQIDTAIADLALVMLGSDYLDLPTCHTEDIEVVLPSRARRDYDTLERDLLVQIATGEIEALSAAALAGKLLQMTGGTVYDAERGVHPIHDAKIDALRKLRKQHPKEPLLVMTMFQHERERLLEAFPEAAQFDERNLAQWQAGKIPMWVTDYRSIAFGLDGLQHGGRIAVWHTTPYSQEGYAQTNARLVRTGQESETIIYRIVARDTIDDAVCESLREKDDTQKGLLNALKALQLLRR